MMKKLRRIMLFTLLLFGAAMWAQEKTVTGVVTDSDELPASDASVTNARTGQVVYSDVDGVYEIQAQEGDILSFAGNGLGNKSITVGAANTYNISLGGGVVELEGAVITALGIPKEKKALGYAVTELGTEDLENRPENDVGRALRGKAAGVRVTGSGGVSGSGTNIIIRGYSSISGNNQPLLVVDGVPVSNASGSVNSGASSGAFQNGNSSSRISDIDPNNIENISVLKGLSATTLYGSEGRNGVILITTKSGKKSKSKLEVDFSQSYFLNEVVLPDYQNTYGAGFQNDYGPFFSNWGSAFSSQATIPNAYQQWASLFPDRPDLAVDEVEYRPFNSQEDFFRTGSTFVTNVLAKGAFTDGNYTVGVGHTTDESFIPGNSFVRNNLNATLNFKLSNKLSVRSSMGFARSDFRSPFTDASTGSDVASSTAGTGGVASVWNILYIPRSVDINLPFQNPITGESIWYRGSNDRTNPRWAAANTFNTQDVNRFIGSVTTAYEVSDNLAFNYRFGLDTFTSDQVRAVNRGARDGIHPNGYLQTGFEKNTILDHNIFGTYSKKDLFANIDFDVTAGFNARRDEFDSNGSESRDQIVFGLLNHRNFRFASNIIEGTTEFSSLIPYQFTSRRNLLGVFAAANFSYNNYLFLNLSARNDWSSTHEPEFNSQFYPGVSVSFLPSEAFSFLKESSVVNFLKLRAGYGSSAGFAPPYTTRQTAVLNSQLFPGLSGGTVANRLANPNIRPELTEEYEFGVEAQFFNNRLGFDVSYYDRETTDLIIPGRSLAPETGFSVFSDNIGNNRNRGVEIGFNSVPLRTKDFEWSLGGIYTINESTVSGLAENEIVNIGGLFATPQNIATNGQSYGVIFGGRFLRNENGDRIVNSNGEWIQDPINGIIGDPNPDWFASITSGLSYKGFTMNMLWEYQHGGDVYAQTVSTLLARGLAGETDFDRTQGIILDGVFANGERNNIQLTATQAYFDNLGFGVDEASIYDATHLRLRELSIGYNLPKSILEGTPFGAVSFSLQGQNLFVRAFNIPESINYDPELNSLGVGNSQGLDYLTSWNSRRYGFNLKLSF